MSYNGFRFIFSGVEPDQYFDMVSKETNNMLMSYHWIQRKGQRFIDARKEQAPEMRLMLDSGAHTFLDEKTRDQWASKPIEYWEEYLTRYCKWIRRNKDIVFSVVELDIQALVGQEVVDKWRDTFFRELEEDGIQVIYVWHGTKPDREWEDLCRRFSYVGFSMNQTSLSVMEISKMFAIARKHKAKIHGFASTGGEMLMKFPFSSADSSVTGDAYTLIKRNGIIQRCSIESLYEYAKYAGGEKQTAPHEKVCPLSGVETMTADENNQIVWKPLYAVTKHTVAKKLLKLSIEGGGEVTCTDDHSIITMDKEGTLTEIKASSLQKGSFVLASKKLLTNHNGISSIALSIQDRKFWRYDTFKEEIVTLDETFLNFLGLWVGDGHLTDVTSSGKVDSQIGLSAYQDIECKTIFDAVCARYGAKVTLSTRNDVDARCSSVTLTAVMQMLGFSGKSHTKRVPPILYSLRKEQIAWFLKGYFSADGSAHSLDCSTVSKELKDDLVELLRVFNIYPSVSYAPPGKYKFKGGKSGDKKASWHLTIRDMPSKIVFFNEIGFLQEYKNSALKEQIEKLSPDKHRGKRLLGVPVELSLTDRVTFPSGSTAIASNYKNKSGGLVRGNREVNTHNFSPKVLNSELLFLEVKDISLTSSGEDLVEVYDLSVRETEKFFANGILVHNTTWLIGSKYGEINYFDGRKMTRLKKPQWKRQYKQKLIKKGLSWKLLEREDPNEMIRASMITFLELESHVKRVMSKKWYWDSGSTTSPATLSKASKLALIKPKKREEETPMAEEKPKKRKLVRKKKVDISVDEVPEETVAESFSLFPTWEWIVSGGDDDWQRFCPTFNLPDTLEKETALTWMQYFYCFITGEHIEEVSTEAMYEVADIFKIPKEQCRSRIMAIDILKQIFRDHAEGKRKDLLEEDAMAEGDDAPAEMPKEREEVPDDAEVELIEMSPVQIHSYLATLLPAESDLGMPEVQAEADKVLAEKGVVAVRDESGRFIGGQRAVRKPKKLLTAKTMPRLSCNNCYAAQNCPKYSPGYVCAYNKVFHKFDSRKLEDIVDAMGAITEESLARAQRQLFFEELDGGMADDNTSKLMDTAFKYLQTLHQLQTPKAAVQHVRVTPNGGVEQTTVSASGGGGFLEKLFATLPSVQKRAGEDREIIDVTPNKDVDK